MGQLIVTAAFIEAALANNEEVSEEIKEAYSDKLEQFCGKIADECVELQMFGENFDRG